LKPSTPEEAAALLREHDGPVRPRGGGTRPWGPPGEGTVLETAGLRRIVEHNVGDFTAVLEAGVPLAEAQAEFAAEGQMLAFDPPADPKATVGGAMASNDSGPLRHRYGGLRDLVVGTTVALSDGTLASSGGRVIKNVAGYDLGKLFCGSYGTLGLITRVAVRLHPLVPETASAVGGSDDAARLGAAAAVLAGRPLEADCLDAAWRDGAGKLLVRFAGAAAAEQAAGAAELMRTLGLEDAAVEEDDDALWAAQRAAQRGACVLKVAGRITDLPTVCATGAAVVGRAGLGVFWLQIAPERVAEVREALHPRACTLLDAPDALRGETWPEPDPGALAVMTRLKQRFDPARAFRPGAFVGGL
jgi:glycolate oxidase FAD binding subunit